VRGRHVPTSSPLSYVINAPLSLSQPERFSNFDDVKPYTFLPFIDGPRNCLGQYIAMLEAKIIISKIFWEYDLEVVEGGKEKDGFMVPVVPKDGVKCKWKRRN
jgi:cytochrome P450